jgi:pSer/pThr/pTyr-binding forkhead associated (FHA) protein
MRARLLYRDAQGRDSAADLVAEGSFVGRAQDCVVRTDDAMVSRRNCKLSLDGDRWYVEDLASSNGTFVNEKRIQRQPLEHADIIRCGTLQVRFVEMEEPVQVSPDIVEHTSELDIARRELENVLADRAKKEQQLFDLQAELDATRLRAETDASELTRLRAEVVAQREKSSELSRHRQLSDEELNAQMRVGEQLRRDLEGLRGEHANLRERADKTSGDLQARDRQLERATEDVQRGRVALDEARGKLAELERTKDAGWRELNNRVGELDNLRAVIAEQERLLEERRVGLISLEASAQDLRQDKEKLLRELVATRSERDESRAQATLLRNQIEGFEEEHRRMQRAISEGSGGSADESLKLASDLRQARVALKTIEAERDRLIERSERADAARAEAEQKVAKLDVERTHALEEKQRAISGRERAEEALNRADTQRKAAEQVRRTVEDADAKLVTEIDKLRSELDAAREEVGRVEASAATQRVAAEEGKRAAVEEARRARDATAAEIAARRQAEQALAEARQNNVAPKTLAMTAVNHDDTSPIDSVFPEEHTLDGGTNGSMADDAEVRIAQLEEALAALGSELAITKAELDQARERPVLRGSEGEQLREIQRRAEDAYHGVNDALTDLRKNILHARQLVGELGADSDAARSLAAAIALSVDSAEDAKGILRTLREVVDA